MRLALIVALIGPWAGWSVAAVLLGGVGPDSAVAPRILALVVGLGAIGSGAWARGRAGGLLVAVAACATVSAWFATLRPSHDRAWTEDQSRLPRVEIAGDLVRVHDLRTFRYRTVDDWDARWTTEVYDLDRLVGVDFVVERFGEWEAVGHTLVSFRFDDGRVLSVSVEIRKEQGEAFSPLKGLFKQYELMYVLGDERDLVELRAVHRRDEVYLHPMRTTHAQARAFLLSLLEGASDLAARPAFYNTLTASCTSTLAWHLEQIADPGLDHRAFLPGYSDALAFELGLIDTELDFAATREANRIDARALQAAGSPEFSARIRAGWTGDLP